MDTKRGLLTTIEVCYLLRMSPVTLKNWYKFINETPPEEIPEDCPGLPPYIQKTPRSQKYWHGSDMHKLYAFQQWVPKGRGGKMGKTSRKYWSKKFYNPDKNSI